MDSLHPFHGAEHNGDCSIYLNGVKMQADTADGDVAMDRNTLETTTTVPLKDRKQPTKYVSLSSMRYPKVLITSQKAGSKQ